MRGSVIQSRGPLRYGIVDGMNVRDSRVHNYSSSAVTLQDASVQGGLKKEKGRKEVCPPRPCTLLGVSPHAEGLFQFGDSHGLWLQRGIVGR